MIERYVYDEIMTIAESCPFSSMTYLDYEDIENSVVLVKNNDLVVLQNNLSEIIFATKSIEQLCDFLKDNNLNGLIKFIPMENISTFEEIGFRINCIFSDFVNPDITKLNSLFNQDEHINYANLEHADNLAHISQLCKGQSRGFNGETAEWFNEWMLENTVIIKTVNSEPIGFCCVSIYNEGTTLWVRELAVSPKFQGQRYARALLAASLQFGIQKGAKNSFLAVDIENHNAIHLYKQFGFVQRENEFEVQMVR
jgi:GNAT superfamily N-acetyltransferase